MLSGLVFNICRWTEEAFGFSLLGTSSFRLLEGEQEATVSNTWILVWASSGGVEYLNS